MRYCTNCGAKLEGLENFCPYCGILFEEFIGVDEKDKRIEELIRKIKELERVPSNIQLGNITRELAILKEQLRSQQKIEIKKRQNNSFCYCCAIIIFLMVLFSVFFPFIIIFPY